MQGLGYNPSVHGTDGPVNVSFSNFIYNQSQNVFTALNELGIPTSFDPNDGLTAGASFLPTSLDSHSQVRADARRSHNTTIYSRTNLDIWTGQHVTRILFEKGSGNTNTTEPVPGDTSVGQGNAPNPAGALFGVDNTTTTPMSHKLHRAAALTQRRSSISHTIDEFRKWVVLKVKRWSVQATEQPPTSTGNTLRAIGVEVGFKVDRPTRSDRG